MTVCFLTGSSCITALLISTWICFIGAAMQELSVRKYCLSEKKTVIPTQPILFGIKNCLGLLVRMELDTMILCSSKRHCKLAYQCHCSFHKGQWCHKHGLSCQKWPFLAVKMVPLCQTSPSLEIHSGGMLNRGVRRRGLQVTPLSN